ncbi:MAG TPA: vWA domain-containing protein [Terriglobales bacterium]|nr:vWA domain-containing protein [Terriglobales bacterium]
MVLQDISGSLGKSNAHTVTMEVVRDFVEAAAPDDQLGLVDFSNQAYFDIPLESPGAFTEQLKKIKGNIRPSGPTILFDALEASADYLHKSSEEGDSVFVISDGLDNASTNNQQQLAADLAKDNVRVYLFLLETPVTDKQRIQLGATLKIISSTGGVTVPLRSLDPTLQTRFDNAPHYAFKEDQLRADVGDIYRLIRNPYRIMFEMTDRIKTPTSVKISLSGPQDANDRLFCPDQIHP